MGIGMKNALDLIKDLVGSFDFAINEQVCNFKIYAQKRVFFLSFCLDFPFRRPPLAFSDIGDSFRSRGYNKLGLCVPLLTCDLHFLVAVLGDAFLELLRLRVLGNFCLLLLAGVSVLLAADSGDGSKSAGSVGCPECPPRDLQIFCHVGGVLSRLFSLSRLASHAHISFYFEECVLEYIIASQSALSPLRPNPYRFGPKAPWLRFASECLLTLMCICASLRALPPAKQQCFQYSECDYYKPFISANKAVLGTEYTFGSTDKVCQEAATRKISLLLSKSGKWYDCQVRGVTRALSYPLF